MTPNVSFKRTGTTAGRREIQLAEGVLRIGCAGPDTLIGSQLIGRRQQLVARQHPRALNIPAAVTLIGR